MDLTSLTLCAAADLIARRELSPVELTRAHLERIAGINPLLNCFITVTADIALGQAREAEEVIAHGEYHGVLHGIPIALKDLFETWGVRTTAGSKILADYVPDINAAVVEKLEEAGAILLGKLNMHEWAMNVTNNNPHYGVCRNPWKLDRIPGGSSGGSAAALAAELCMASLGSDTGGSIRIPASLCGVVGLKPTFGRVSARGILPLSWNLDHVGPMARRVRDVAVLLQAIAGYDPEDPFSQEVPVGEYVGGLENGVRGIRVALGLGEFATEAVPEVWQAVVQASQIFEQLGAQVAEVDIRGVREMTRLNSRILRADAAAYHRDWMQERPEEYGEDVLEMLKNGATLLGTEYALARHRQAQLRRQFDEFFAEYDILLTPTTAMAAPPIAESQPSPVHPSLTLFTAPFNLTGLPALSIPCGFTKEGLPIGLQIVGPPWSEARLLRAGYAYEQATEWHVRRPALKMPWLESPATPDE